MAVQRYHDRQSDSGFRRSHRHDEEHDDLSFNAAVLTAECDEREVHRVEHDLDRQQNRDQIPPQEHTRRADRKEHHGYKQVMSEGNHDSPSRRASTTAPTIATRIRIDVASNGNT